MMRCGGTEISEVLYRLDVVSNFWYRNSETGIFRVTFAKELDIIW